MHVAIDARIINSSTGRYIERLLTYLQTIDTPHEFSVLVRAKDKDYWKPTNPNFKVVVADYHQYTFAEQIGFYFFLKKLSPDLVHFCMPQQPLLYRGTAVTTVHDLNLLKITDNEAMSPVVLKIKQFIFQQLLRSVLRRSHTIIVPTDYTGSDVANFEPRSKDRIIRTYEAADKVSNVEEVVAQYTDKQFLLVVGRADTYKNQRGAIEAHQLLLEKFPDLCLVIVGKRDETSEELEHQSASKGYRNIHFFGFASDAQLAWLYSHCATYIFPSFMEGFGLPGLEAMAHGAPVASSNTTCLPEVYGDAALYFDPANVHDMATQIEKILSDTTLRKKIIENGTRQVGRYSWRKMADETYAIYQKALGINTD